MIRNFFLLNRLVIELNRTLSGFTVLSAFSQEKDKIIMECRRKEDTIYLEISSDPLFPYITVKEKFSRAKKNVFDLFNDILPSSIEQISIAKSDRVIKISFQNPDIFFYIRGNRTNVIAAKESSVISFKKLKDTEAQRLYTEFSRLDYISDKRPMLPEEVSVIPEKELMSRYPFIGKEILLEAKSRNSGDLVKDINNVIDDVFINKPAVYSGEEETKLAVEGFLLYKGWSCEVFDDLISAVNYYIIKKYSSEYFQKRKRSLLGSVEKELERTASKINNLKGRLDAGSKDEEYNKLANLLLINLDRFRKGEDEIALDDIYENNRSIKIKIDPSLSPQQNAEKYFEKARSERINYVKSKEMYKAATDRYTKLKEDFSRLTEASTAEELRKMDTKKEQVHKEDKEDLKSKFRQYLIDGKYKLYIGRDSEKNDLLTMRFAKQNDYWFHARSVSGSHAVLRIESSKEPVPKSVLKKAAAIAAYHSKAKTSSIAPVSYTLKKYVTKKKGMEPGKVNLLKEEVLLVKPEIPAGCEYISSE